MEIKEPGAKAVFPQKYISTRDTRLDGNITEGKNWK